MVKRIMALLMLVIFLPAIALADLPMVIDDAGLFTSSEISEMETIITRIRDTYQMDVVVVTSYEPKTDTSGSDYSTQLWADEYYDDHGYGLGSDNSGLLYLIDMHNRVPCISTTGTMADYITDHRLEELFDCSYDDLAKGKYGRSTLQLLNQLEIFLNEGREEGSFRYDAETGERLSGIYNRLTIAEALFAFVLALGIASIFMLIVSRRYSLKGSTYKYNAASACQYAFTDDRETFLRSHVTRTPRIQNSSHGGHVGGGGMGSSMHGGGFHGGGTGRHF